MLGASPWVEVSCSGGVWVHHLDVAVVAVGGGCMECILLHEFGCEHVVSRFRG